MEDLHKPAREFSGRLSLRVPRSLHRALVLRAGQEGVNLNKFAVAALAVALSWNSGAGARMQEGQAEVRQGQVDDPVNEYGKSLRVIERERAEQREWWRRIRE